MLLYDMSNVWILCLCLCLCLCLIPGLDYPYVIRVLAISCLSKCYGLRLTCVQPPVDIVQMVQVQFPAAAPQDFRANWVIVALS